MHAGIDLDQLGVHGTQRAQSRPRPRALRDAGAQVAVDFTVIDAARENLAWCAENGVHAVVGTTGFTDAELADFAERFERSDANAVIAPNFAIGAVLDDALRRAGRAVLRERRDHRAPPRPEDRRAVGHGDAHRAADRGRVEGLGRRPDHEGRRRGRARRPGRAASRCTRCGCAGMVASQEVLLGTTGQSLSIRHDTYDRSSFMPGVLLAVQKVADTPGLTVGLDALLGL